MELLSDRLSPGDRIVMAMSGGVDSSVSAALLADQGYELVGLFMRSGVSGAESTGEKQGCCSVEDSMDARRVADTLDMPFYALNMETEFQAVIDDFVASYERGETPNPCVQCNRLLKFGHLLEFAKKVGARGVATGHYARVGKVGERLTLLRPLDDDKDQTYVLFVLSQEQLANTLLPLGELRKSEVRRLAGEKGFARVAGKRDSVEICFVPGDYRSFLKDRVEPRPGEFVSPSGEVLGTHDGIHRFTIGQRRKLGITLGRPVYVVAIEPETARVVLGDDEDLFARRLVAGRANWLALAPPEPGLTRRVRAQIRYNGSAEPATLTALGDDRFQLDFDEPQRAVTPGQAAVCYDEDNRYVLCGGWIEAERVEV